MDSHTKERKLVLRCIRCSYCNSKMEGGAINVKRNVPSGANDLGITDEVFSWICPKCNLTSTDYLRYCDNCGALTLDCLEDKTGSFPKARGPGLYGYLRYFQNYYFNDDELDADYRCFHCIVCSVCEKYIESETFMEVVNVNQRDNSSQSKFIYFHSECHNKREKDKEEKVRQDRIKKGNCVVCDKPIGLLDKISGREKHKSC